MISLAADALRGIFAALQADQVTGVGRLLSEGFTLEVTGRSRLRGTYRGREGFTAFLRRRREGLAEMEAFGEEILVSDVHAVLLYAVRAGRGSESLLSHEILVAHHLAGRLTESFLYVFDQEAFDRFWA